MKSLTMGVALLAAAVGAACGSAAGSIPVGELGITARDAFLEARSVARGWDAGSRLRYVEGVGVATTGQVLPGAGEWRFHYSAPRQAAQLVVRVAPLEVVSEERAPMSPPGYVIGDNALDESWIDSPAVLAAVQADGSGGAASTATLLLVPTIPPRWVVRFAEGTARRVVNAQTGEVMER